MYVFGWISKQRIQHIKPVKPHLSTVFLVFAFAKCTQRHVNAAVADCCTRVSALVDNPKRNEFPSPLLAATMQQCASVTFLQQQS
jgi:siroheme synthase (precorrin-2 oxidase/ferrochelatase)